MADQYIGGIRVTEDGAVYVSGGYNPASVAITGGTISGISSFSTAASATWSVRWGSSASDLYNITAAGTFFARSNAAGAKLQIVLATQPTLRLASDSVMAFNSGADLGSGSLDTGVARNAAGVVEINTGTAGALGSLKAANLIAAGAAVSAGASTIAYGGTTASTVGAAGGASALPATPTGYIIINVAGTAGKIPYYAS